MKTNENALLPLLMLLPLTYFCLLVKLRENLRDLKEAEDGASDKPRSSHESLLWRQAGHSTNILCELRLLPFSDKRFFLSWFYFQPKLQIPVT